MFGLFCSYFPRKGTPVLEHSLIDVLLLIEDISESEGYIYIYKYFGWEYFREHKYAQKKVNIFFYLGFANRLP